jgi:hypothetical protein
MKEEMIMRKPDVASLEGMFNSVLGGLKTIAERLLGVAERVAVLEAENRELRRLWIECEADNIEIKVRLDKIWQAATPAPKGNKES